MQPVERRRSESSDLLPTITPILAPREKFIGESSDVEYYKGEGGRRLEVSFLVRERQTI